MAAYEPEVVNVGPPESAEPLTAAAVTPDFFPLLGAAPGLGRGFLADEGRPGAGQVVVLDHGYWQSHFGGDPDVLGRTMTIDGEARTIVGVLPERFEFLDPQVDLWEPLAIDPATARDEQRGVLVVARLAPGVSTAEADAAMKTLSEGLEDEYPDDYRGSVTEVLNLRHSLPSSQDRILLGLIQGALVFVLLIACANVANLFLARTQGRITELAVRSSLGAGRWRIARQLAVEALVASSLGGLLGLGGGVLATGVLADAFAARLPRFCAAHGRPASGALHRRRDRAGGPARRAAAGAPDGAARRPVGAQGGRAERQPRRAPAADDQGAGGGRDRPVAGAPGRRLGAHPELPRHPEAGSGLRHGGPDELHGDAARGALRHAGGAGGGLPRDRRALAALPGVEAAATSGPAPTDAGPAQPALHPRRRADAGGAGAAERGGDGGRSGAVRDDRSQPARGARVPGERRARAARPWPWSTGASPRATGRRPTRSATGSPCGARPGGWSAWWRTRSTRCSSSAAPSRRSTCRSPRRRRRPWR